jgi:hypothetical protein
VNGFKRRPKNRIRIPAIEMIVSIFYERLKMNDVGIRRRKSK